MKRQDIIKLMDIMIKELLQVNNIQLVPPEGEKAKSNILKSLMTISVPTKLSNNYYEAEKSVIEYLNRTKEIIPIEDINQELMEAIYIFKGDITSIKADAIVNAGNEKLLGCFVPGHHCIDNAIHINAGLGLRNACKQIMEEQGHDEETGLAKITKGYNLPSSYVIHTVGPNVNGYKKLTNEEIKNQLENCYLSILREISNYQDIKNIVFCSISTGVYGVDIKMASHIALTTISNYLNNETHHIERVVIDVFSEIDYQAYLEAAQNIKEAKESI